MHKVIFDCDNTMGVPDRDIDDGLALLFLLGRKDVDIMGITTTFGNSTIDIVHQNTEKMLRDLKIDAIPLHKGAATKNYRHSSASKFLADMAKEHKGEITLLATGSLTNLLGAYEIDSTFFHNLKQIVLMGGITEPLIINKKNLEELNFSCDPEAAHRVLSSNSMVTVLTGQICLQAFFGENELNRMQNDDHPIYKYIAKSAENWYKTIMEGFQVYGFYNWDIVAALYITHPELFDINISNVISTKEDLQRGYLKISDSNINAYMVNIPTKISDMDMLKKAIFEAWEGI